MTPDSVAQYYDRNTRRFLRLGGSGNAAAIHRPVWAPGVETAEQAFEYLNRVVAEAIQPAVGLGAPARLLDLGCGVGGTATWLAGHMDATVIGITNSPVQLQIAEQRAEALGLAQRCRFMLADFLSLPAVGPLEAAYAIESFVHAGDARRFFSAAAAQIAPSGRLVICDDFLDETAANLPRDSQAQRTLRRFIAGWHIHNLMEAGCAVRMAGEHGLRLVANLDLTPYLRSFHPLVLHLVFAVTRLPLSWAYWQNLSGGSALQICIRRGWSQYRVLVFEKEA